MARRCAACWRADDLGAARAAGVARGLAQPAVPARNPAQHRAAARKRILREVEDTIQRTPTPDGAALQAELQDRLDTPDVEDDLTTRPIPEIITEICRDLGLASTPGAHPWKRRTPGDIQQLCTRAATPSRQQPGAGPKPSKPAIPQATAPVQAASDPPSDSAGLIPTILRHPHGRDRWRPSPGV